MMLVILAYSHDRAAYALAERWRAAGEDAGVLTCADLSRRGWLHRPGYPDAGRAVVDDRIVPTAEIRAVVVRMPAVAEAEVMHVHEQDRTYAVAEMQAFLLAWLTSLQCPVINRPTTCNLGGPIWHVSEWVMRARRLGVAVRPVAWRSSSSDAFVEMPRRLDASLRFVDIVGPRAFLVGGRAPGPADDAFAAAALMLARDAGVEVMRAYFDRTSDGAPVFVEAGLWVDLDAASIADALTEYCLGVVGARRDQRVAAGSVARA
jgi:hypothetical protein